MTKTVLEFTGGVRCEDCEEQIPPARIQAVPTAKRCVPCQNERNKELQLSLQTVGDNDVIIIRNSGRYQI